MAGRPAVYIGRLEKESSNEAFMKALDAIGWRNIIKSDDTVAVKYNGCHYVYLPGLNTTPEFLGDVVSILKDRAADVVVVEADLQRFSADYVYEKAGYRKVIEGAGGRFVNLTKDRMVEVEMPGAHWKRRKMPKTLVEADRFISMPVLKTHKLWNLSLGIKNQFGCVPEADRVKYQKYLPQVLYDFNAFLKPAITIFDGYIGLEGDGPIAGIPKKVGVVIAGTNIIAADSVAAAVMGFDPLSSELIKYSHERGLGPVKLEEIDLKGLKIEVVAKRFRGPSTDFVSNMERWVRKHPRLANFVYRSWFFKVAKSVAWGIRGLYGYKSQYHREVEETGLWADYDWEHILKVYTPIA
ncbi:MAG: DUF362 domain-containing protein [Thermoplasmata archaeon]|nr:DUF362 domain-containing protein [Thermoplasmata archaeon]